MKTPKRTYCDIYQCRQCGGYGITYTENDIGNTLFECSLCGMCTVMKKIPERTRDFLTRCTRKNREARLRHKIAVLQRKVKELERDLEYACTSQF